MEDLNDFITSAENIATDEAVSRLAKVVDPSFQPLINKDLVGDFELFSEDAKAVVWDETKKKVTVNGVIDITPAEEPEPEPEVLAAPEITLDMGYVTITAAEGADIFYTIDGSEPTAEGTKYEAPFELEDDATVKAIAVKGDLISEVAEKEYVKNPAEA